MTMSLVRSRLRARYLLPCLALGLACSQPAFAAGATVTPEMKAQLVALSTGELKSYYVYGAGPLWIDAAGSLDPAATELLKLVQTADEDGLDPASLGAGRLAQAVTAAQASPTPANIATADVLLSQAFTAYVAALRGPGSTPMQYETAQLGPQKIGPYLMLSEAAKAPSLADYVHNMAWMHPLYAPLRHALMDSAALPPAERQAAMTNLQRIRQIPALPNGRHVLIDVANATLYMYEGNRVVDSMRVIVGKTATPTPIYAGYIRYAVTNPYWNVPENLVQSLIARNVLAQGPKYLKRQGYEVVDGWEPGAQVLDPLTIDWAGARRGDVQLHVRQLPGPINSMGKVKYEFPNVYGIYLHDTPERDLLQKDVRQLSNGCIRLEDAQRFGRWLMEGDIASGTDAPEQKVDLPRPMPLYITYLTTRVDGDRIALGPDPYGHDGTALATLN